MFTPAQTKRTKGGNKPGFNLHTGVITALDGLQRLVICVYLN